MTKKEFNHISTSMGEYLQTIYRLQDNREPVGTTDLAERLGVAPSSVTYMIRKLHRRGMVAHVPYRGVTLTASGAQEALRLLRVHRLWELFLSTALGIPWDLVHEEACRLERATSDNLAQRLADYLDHPKRDPHGHRIPSPEGTLSRTDTVALSEVRPDQSVTLVEVPDHEADLLRFLAQLGLLPGASVHVIARAPSNGPLTIKVGGTEHLLDYELSTKLSVSFADSDIEESNA